MLRLDRACTDSSNEPLYEGLHFGGGGDVGVKISVTPCATTAVVAAAARAANVSLISNSFERDEFLPNSRRVCRRRPCWRNSFFLGSERTRRPIERVIGLARVA